MTDTDTADTDTDDRADARTRTIRANITGSVRLPKGWAWAAHWSNPRAGQSGYYLRRPDGTHVTVTEGGARCPTIWYHYLHGTLT